MSLFKFLKKKMSCCIKFFKFLISKYYNNYKIDIV